LRKFIDICKKDKGYNHIQIPAGVSTPRAAFGLSFPQIIAGAVFL